MNVSEIDPLKQRVLIVEAWAAVSDMMGRIFAADTRFEILAKVSSGFEGLRVFRETNPDIVITALSLPEMNGCDLAAIIREEKPDARILIFTGTTDRGLLAAGFAASPHGFVHKSEPVVELERAVEAILGGASYTSPFSSELRSGIDNQDCSAKQLTAKQRTVLKLIAESKSSKEVAEHLGISPKTVESYRAQFSKRLGLRDTAAIARYAVQHGLTKMTTIVLAPFLSVNGIFC